MQFNKLVTIVLAGNDEDRNLLGGIGQSSKFFMPFGQELVGDRILRAIDALECCVSIYVAVPPGLVQNYSFISKHPLHLVSQGRTHTESMMTAVREAERQGQYVEGDHLLVVMGDLPLLCPGALERFIAACEGTQEADCYIGMIPLSAVDQTLHETYERDLLPFYGGLYLHSDVYLLRPSSLTEVGRKRVEKILSIRRSDRSSLRDVLRVAVTLLSTVGFRGLFPFVRTVAGLQRSGGGNQG